MESEGRSVQDVSGAFKGRLGAFWSPRTTTAVLLLVSAAYYFITLDRYPVFWDDDAIYAELGYYMIREGVPRAPSMGETDRIPERCVPIGHIQSFLVGLCDWLAGPSVRAVRFPAFISGIACLPALFILGKSLGHPWIGTVAAGWFAAGDDFYRFSHEGRAEMMLTAFLLWSWVLFEKGRTAGSKAWLVASGLLLGLSMEVHMNAALLLFAMGGGVLWSCRRDSAWWIAGTVPGILGWLILHVLVDPALFIQQWRNYWSYQSPAPFPISPLSVKVSPAWDTFVSYFWIRIAHYKAPLALLLLAGAVGAWFSGQRACRLFLLALGLQLTAYFLFAKPQANYVFLFLPIGMLLSARLVLCAGARFDPRWSRLRPGVVALVGGYFLSTTVAAHVKYSGHDQHRYFDYAARVRSLVPLGKVVMGPPSLGYAMRDYPYYSWILLWCVRSEDGRRRYGTDLQEILDRAGVEYVVTERQTERNMQEVAGSRWSEIRSRWREVGSFSHDFYGGESMGFQPGEPRVTRILRITR